MRSMTMPGKPRGSAPVSNASKYEAATCASKCGPAGPLDAGLTPGGSVECPLLTDAARPVTVVALPMVRRHWLNIRVPCAGCQQVPDRIGATCPLVAAVEP